MWASWCLGSIGGLAEVVRRGDSMGKRDINNYAVFGDWSEGMECC